MFFSKKPQSDKLAKPDTGHKQASAQANQAEQTSAQQRKLLTIEGMSCGHCAMRTETALREVAGVQEVHVELVKKTAMVSGNNLNDVALRRAVEEAGYQVTGIVGSA